jgi:hypothetical protein
MSDATASAGPAPATPTTDARPANAVRLTDLDVPFLRLVAFFVKAGLAAIPAVIILMLTIALTGALLRGLFRIGYWGLHGGHGYW